MNKPRLLDAFCGAGGCTRGYQLAGFHVTGVDLHPQPNYCGDEFIQMDALEYLAGDLSEFSAVHCSPPCQAYSVAGNRHHAEHPDLIAEMRRLLEATGLPYVIENVVGAPLREATLICGLALGLNVKRHRLFETSFPIMAPPCARHDADYLSVFGEGSPRRRQHGNERESATAAEGREAMGIDWMTPRELSQAIPPAYTELIGHQLAQWISSARSQASA